jgi:CubicO group peptidase (beta-lactamase class C family)
MSTAPDELGRQLSRWLQHRRDRFQGPGVVVGVTDQRRPVTTLVSSGSGHEIDGSRLFLLASVSKSFTATLVSQEVGAGRLALDEPVRTYLPWFAPPSPYPPFTVEHLLTHTAGLATGYDSTGDAVHELLLIADQEVASAPGEHHVYSNAGYKALGLVLEAVSGRPWWELCRERILEPLGMHATEPVITNEVRPRLAQGWVPPLDDRPWRPEHGLVHAPWYESYTADGTICSNAEDVLAYVRMYLNDGGDVLPPEAVERMTRGDVADPETHTRYGFGLWVLERDGNRLVGHSGSLPGFRSMILFDRERRFGGVVLTNGEVDWRTRVDLLAFAIDAAAGEGRELPEPETRTTVADAAPFVGRYATGDGTSLEILAEGDGLAGRVDGAVARLERFGEDAFVLPLEGWDRYPLSFEREDGRVLRAVNGPRVLQREGAFVLPPPPTDPSWDALVGRYRCYGIEPMNVEVVIREGSLRMVTTAVAEDEELVPLGDGRFRVGREPWMPGRARFETAVGDRATRVILDGASFARVP